MTTPFWCLLVMVLIPYVLAGLGAHQRAVQLGSVDNSNWRANQLPKLTGMGSRLYAAQANAWEAVGMFTAAVMVAHFAGADAYYSSVAALVFIAARILHAILYALDLDKLRTVAFLTGWASCLALFGMAIRA